MSIKAQKRRKMSKVTKGHNISVHYVGTFDDGTKFDSSHDRGEPLSFNVGSGQMIAGFDAAVVGMTVGEKKTVNLSADDAYGSHNPEAIQTLERSVFPEDVTLEEGAHVIGQNELGQKIVAKVLTLSDTEAVLDFNHPLAGKSLNFDVEIVSINEALSKVEEKS